MTKVSGSEINVVILNIYILVGMKYDLDVF